MSDVEAAARALLDGIGLYTTGDGIRRASWPVDRDADSEPETDALAWALYDALDTAASNAHRRADDRLVAAVHQYLDADPALRQLVYEQNLATALATYEEVR